MARSIDTIQANIIADVQAQPELAAATSTSKRAIWRLWTYVVAVAINALEQIIDLFVADTEAKIATTPPHTTAWLLNEIYKFQYSATVPQTIILDSTTSYMPQYQTVNAAYRIITRASVKTNYNYNVLVKVAKNNPPEALTTTELTNFGTYMNTIGVAGVKYLVSSTASDKLYIQATIYYNGSYASVISANVIAGINTFLANLTFDGSIKVSDIEQAILGVEGVNDVVLVNVRARQDSDALASATYLVQSQQVISRQWNTISGYAVTETTAGNTITDTLTFVAE